jgi:hypothetical protein
MLGEARVRAAGLERYSTDLLPGLPSSNGLTLSVPIMTHAGESAMIHWARSSRHPHTGDVGVAAHPTRQPKLPQLFGFRGRRA